MADLVPTSASPATLQFWDSCNQGNPEQLPQLPLPGVDLNWRHPSHDNQVILSVACHRRQVELVRHLLSLPDLDPNLVEIPPCSRMIFRDPSLAKIIDLLLLHPRLDLGKVHQGPERLWDWAMHHQDHRLARRLLEWKGVASLDLGSALHSAGGLGQVQCPALLQLLLEHPPTPINTIHPTLLKTPVELACFFGNQDLLSFLIASDRDIGPSAAPLLGYDNSEARLRHLCPDCMRLLRQWGQDPHGSLVRARRAVGWRQGAADLYVLATLIRQGQVGQVGSDRQQRGLGVMSLVNDNLRMRLANRACGIKSRDIITTREIQAAMACRDDMPGNGGDNVKE